MCGGGVTVRKNHLTRFTAGMIVTLLLAALGSGRVLANSAWLDYRGTDATGMVLTDENCPLEVLHETLTIDVQDFPETDYDSAEDFLTYSGKVTAEYTFYNPTEYTVEATLVFPFGTAPEYGLLWDENYSRRMMPPDTDRYEVTVDNAAVDKTLRHTLAMDNASFDCETDLNKLRSGLTEDAFYHPELSVTKYTYRVENGDTDPDSSESVSLILDEERSKTKVFMDGFHRQELADGGVRVYARAKNEIFVLYAFGEPLHDEPNWKFYTNYLWEEETEAQMSLVSEESLTFQEFVEIKYKEESEISDISEVSFTDWYNAYVDLLHEKEWYGGVIKNISGYYDRGYQLMRWYEYTIEVEPGEQVINTVTAPLYPSIQGGGGDLDYTYTYLLSPAKSWANFGDLDIWIYTPHTLAYSSLDGFSEIVQEISESANSADTDETAEEGQTGLDSGEIAVVTDEVGYYLHLDALPEDELVFMLDQEDSLENPGGVDRGPASGNSGSRIILVTIVLLIFVFILLIVGIILLVWLLIRFLRFLRSRSRKRR